MSTYANAQDAADRVKKTRNAHNTDKRLSETAAGTVVQPKSTEAAGGSPPALPPKNNTGLPDNLKNGLEKLSGYSMDDVQVHYNSSKPAQLYAHAYAQGNHIHIAPGQEKHVPHEAWHVVQQKQGRVAPTAQLKGININFASGLEHEADVMGTKALNAGQTPNPDTPVPKSVSSVAAQALGWESLGWLNPRRYAPEAIGGYDARNMEKIRKKDLVGKVVTQNVKEGKDGWFYLHDDQMETYTERVFGLLDEIRNSDMNVLMIAHQQTNIESEATPEDKVKTLAKYLGQTDDEIAKLSDFDIDFLQRSKTAKHQQRKQMLQDTPGETESIQKLTDEMRGINERLGNLRTKKTGQDEMAKLEKLKAHRQRLQRESELQKSQAGKKGINVDLLNTTETDKDNNEFVRLYMAIVAPNFNNKFKDFYMNNNQKLTFSANDKVMWVSFGTPFRSLSWFQKYAFEAKGDNVPLVRSFQVPTGYMERFMKDLSTEDEEMRKGAPVAKSEHSFDLEEYYGSDFRGQKYDTEISVIEPHLMNVDVKYPNQFGLGRLITTEERPKDREFFKRTKKMETDRQEEYEHGLYDEQINSINAKIKELEADKSKFYEKEYKGENEEAHTQAITKMLKEGVEWNGVRELQKNKGYLTRLVPPPLQQVPPPQDGEENERPPDANRLMVIRRILEGEKMTPGIKVEQDRLAVLKQKKKEAEDRLKTITGGNAKLKSELARLTEELRKSHNPSGLDLASASMTELLKQAVPGSFKTIALAKDRRFEHMPDKEGPLEDYPDFMGDLGLSPTAHFLDSEHTAFHHLDKGDWGSQSPSQTAHIYSKMRFFYHGLDSHVSGADPLAKVKKPDKMDDPDITRDSHLKEVVSMIKAKNIPNEKMQALAAIYSKTDVAAVLREILDMNRLSPADVFGLPKQQKSDRRDRHGNLMVRAAAETYFAERSIASEKSLAFIAANVQSLITEIENPKKAKGLVKKLSENAYLKRDIQELMAESTPEGDGIRQEVPVEDKTNILKVLESLKNIEKEKDRHKQLRMVYLFFHILRPYAKELENSKNRKDPKEQTSGKLKGTELEVNNRTEKLDHFHFLNPRTKAFGLLDDAPDDLTDMPYDKLRSPQHYVPKEGSKATGYMREQELPFVGGVSGTTRDQNQVLEDIFDPKQLKDHYWDFQLMNAAFMIGNGYHSFFETIYVAARYDRYTPIGEKVLAQFDRAKAKGVPQHEIYINILKLVNADDRTFEGFEKWYDAKVKKGETDTLDKTSWFDYRTKRYGLAAASDKVGGPTTKDGGKATKTGTGSGSAPAVRPDISPDYLYEDNDIQALLTIQAAQHNLQNVHIMAAVDDVTGGQLRQHLVDNAQHHNGTARTLLVPYNMGRYHWIGVLIRIAANERDVTVEVMDPLRATRNYEVPARITQEVRAQYNRAVITAVAHKLQDDGSSCGVLTIENLIGRARNINLGVDEQVARGATVLRQAHVNLMTQHRPEANFAHKQKFEQYSFSSFDVRKYMSGKGSGAISLSEMKGVLEIIKTIKQLDNHKEIAAAFTILNQKDKELKDVLDPLRLALNTTLALAKGGNVPLGKHFMEVLGAIFVVNTETVQTLNNVNALKIRNVSLIENIAAYIDKSDELQKDDVLKKTTS